jgi:hypothetical protein
MLIEEQVEEAVKQVFHTYANSVSTVTSWNDSEPTFPFVSIIVKGGKAEEAGESPSFTGNWVLDLELTAHTHAEQQSGAAHKDLCEAVREIAFDSEIVSKLHAANVGSMQVMVWTPTTFRHDQIDAAVRQSTQSVEVYVAPLS